MEVFGLGSVCGRAGASAELQRQRRVKSVKFMWSPFSLVSHGCVSRSRAGARLGQAGPCGWWSRCQRPCGPVWTGAAWNVPWCRHTCSWPFSRARVGSLPGRPPRAGARRPGPGTRVLITAAPPASWPASRQSPRQCRFCPRGMLARLSPSVCLALASPPNAPSDETPVGRPGLARPGPTTG